MIIITIDVQLLRLPQAQPAAAAGGDPQENHEKVGGALS